MFNQKETVRGDTMQASGACGKRPIDAKPAVTYTACVLIASCLNAIILFRIGVWLGRKGGQG